MPMLRITVQVLLTLALLAGATTSIAAQEEPTLTEMDLEGLEKMYGRSFAADITAMVDVGMASPEAGLSGWFVLTTLVLQFDSADNASAGLETIREEIVSTGEAGGGVAMEEVELDLDGLEYSAQRVEQEQDGVTTTMLLVTAQDGEYVYAVIGLTFGADPVPVIETTIGAMRDAEISDDEEVFHEDGTSMGGLWAKLPRAEDITAQAEALTWVSDAVYFPAPAGTPAA